MTTFFNSDTHFGHAGIIKMGAGRPFASVGEMDAVLVANWNSRVRPNDDVWHLGDFTMGVSDVAAGYLKRLHGRNLVRTRAMAVEDYRRKRQHFIAFLLRHGRSFDGRTS